MELLPLCSLPVDKVEQSSPSHILEEEEDAVGGGLVVVQQPNHVRTPPLGKTDYTIILSSWPFSSIGMDVWHFTEMVYVNEFEHLKELMLYTYMYNNM